MLTPLSSVTTYGGLYEAIVPNLWDIGAIRLHLLGWLRHMGAQANELYRATVTEWKRKPTFAVQHAGLDRQGNMFVIVGPGKVGARMRPERGDLPADKLSPNEIYQMVDYGTALHEITATGRRVPGAWRWEESPDGRPLRVGTMRWEGKYLTFRRLFVPKTRRGWIGSQAGYRGGGWVRKASVWQGIEPRGFTSNITRIMQIDMERGIYRQIYIALHKAGMIGSV